MKSGGQDEGTPIRKVTADHAKPERRESDEQFRELMAHLQQAFWIKNAADDAIAHHGVPAARVAFLPKPCSPAQLAHKVCTMLDR